MTPRERFRLTGHHVLVGLIAFFGVVIAVNGAFVYFALATWTGLDTDDAYSRGLAYNDVLAAAEQQHRLGWLVDFGIGNGAPRSALIDFRVRDADGRALEGLTVDAKIRRPTNDGFDRNLALRETTPGTYRGEVALPKAGNWDIRVTAREGDVVRYVVDERAWIR